MGPGRAGHRGVGAEIRRPLPRRGPRVLESMEDSEECVSDTWLRSWNTVPPQRPNLLGAFLARITRNLALDRWRRNHAAKRLAGETALALEELGDCVSGESMEDEADRRELVRALNGFLCSLPEQDCSLFLRRYWSVSSFLFHPCRIRAKFCFCSARCRRPADALV